MSRAHRRVRADGRSSDKPTPGAKKSWQPEPPFALFPHKLIKHLIDCRLSANAYQVLMFLCFEHLSHGGYENANLFATYDQLKAAGIRRSSIRTAFIALEEAGLVRRTDGGAMRDAAQYEVTFLPTADPETKYQLPPKDSWKFIARRKGDAA
ncbi:hypothetical protein [Elstera sp.]|jgi:hypothetical protein|uniref:hypothetical protein n=1 Tax=Elstera sp. TaxID=1916664 RepID=UPI0037BE4207